MILRTFSAGRMTLSVRSERTVARRGVNAELALVSESNLVWVRERRVCANGGGVEPDDNVAG